MRWALAAVTLTRQVLGLGDIEEDVHNVSEGSQRQSDTSA